MKLECPRCGYTTDEYRYKCPRCGSPLELATPIDYKSILGEGDTPLVEEEYKGRRIYLKLDYLNPTGSFKDRGVSASIQVARRLGYRCVVEDSSGNTGISTAAYAAHEGLKAYITTPRGAAEGKKKLIQALGATLITTDTREEAARRAEELSGECFYIAHAWSPIFIEGISRIAGEIPEDLAELPIFIPVSSGTLLLGLYRGLTGRGYKPRIYAVQSPQADSLARRVGNAKVIGSGQGLLDALVYRDPPRIGEMAGAVAGVYVVGWSVARRYYEWLLRRGYIIEPSSSVVLAALDHAGGVDEALLILTGSGLKYIGSI